MPELRRDVVVPAVLLFCIVAVLFAFLAWAVVRNPSDYGVVLTFFALCFTCLVLVGPIRVWHKAFRNVRRGITLGRGHAKERFSYAKITLSAMSVSKVGEAFVSALAFAGGIVVVMLSSAIVFSLELPPSLQSLRFDLRPLFPPLSLSALRIYFFLGIFEVVEPLLEVLSIACVVRALYEVFKVERLRSVLDRQARV